MCGCEVRAWHTPAPGDRGLQCATCGDWIPWELVDSHRAEFDRWIVAAQRQHDPGGFRPLAVGVELALREWREAEIEGREPTRWQPSPEEWRQAQQLVDKRFGAGFGG